MTFERYKEVLNDLKMALIKDIRDNKLDKFYLTRLAEETEEIQEILEEELDLYN